MQTARQGLLATLRLSSPPESNAASRSVSSLQVQVGKHPALLIFSRKEIVPTQAEVWEQA